MGKIDYFKIVLHKTNAIYIAGEPIVGTVRIKVAERLKINSIKLNIIGNARVYW